jgi:fibro-slime domain-containing protein
MKKFFLSLILALAFFAGNALAQCSGKTVYIKLPAEWGNSTYIWWDGYSRQIFGVKNGEWTMFTLPTNLSNDNATKREIVFSDFDYLYNANGINYITVNAFGKSNDLPNATLDKFICSQFGPDQTYIFEDPTTPGKTIVSFNPPDAYYFYFLPPKDDNWILGKPYFFYGTTAEPLELDPDKCGWYRMVYFNKPVPDDQSLIILGSNWPSADMIGVMGMQEDPSEWINGMPTPIRLKTQFNRFLGENTPGSMYFLADEGIWHNGSGVIPIEKERCTYSLAAFVYQRTLYSNTNGFSWYEAASDTREFGICKGLVQPTLGANGKMQWRGNNCTNSYSGVSMGGWTQNDFNNAFKETSGQNKLHCYDMPFTQRPGNLWEFDAFYLCKDGVTTDYNSTETTGCNGQGNVGGFYNMKDADGAPLGAGPLYNGNRVDVKPDYKWCFDRGWLGTGTGDLSNATTAAEINSVMQAVCTSQITSGLSDAIEAHCPNWGNGTGCTSTPEPKDVRGGHFCFESQDAEFYYAPGQELFFRGDDDIWVFISNQLVIDLGGNHMPAPGYIKLDTLRVSQEARSLANVAGKRYGQQGELIVDEKYPIKIFFCDRRGPGANVRIATNLHFAKATKSSIVPGLFLREDRTICLNENNSSCATLNVGMEAICGERLAPRLSYRMSILTEPRLELPLNEDNEDCRWSETQGLCYGGILIDNGKVIVDESEIFDEFLRNTGFEIYASVSSYSPLNVSTAMPREPVNIRNVWQAMLNAQEPAYYNLKGKPLGSKKPSTVGVYIMRQNGKSKPIVVR